MKSFNISTNHGFRPLPLELWEASQLFETEYISTKMAAVLEILDDIAHRSPSEKTIIFVSLCPSICLSSPRANDL
jgi:hypothetical protein